MTNFEDYLRAVHARTYTGADDDMPDAFEAWISNLEADELIQHANEAIEILTK